MDLTGISSLFLPYETSPDPLPSSDAANGHATVFRHSILEVQLLSPHNARSWFMESDEVVGGKPHPQ